MVFIGPFLSDNLFQLRSKRIQRCPFLNGCLSNLDNWSYRCRKKKSQAIDFLLDNENNVAKYHSLCDPRTLYQIM